MSDALALGGWRLLPAFAHRPVSGVSRDFYAVYAGDAFSHPERGIIAILARGLEDRADGDTEAARLKAARDAAQVVTHGFADGYFGAARTLSPRRAAERALNSMSAWLHGIRRDAPQGLAPVALAVLIFSPGRLDVLNTGGIGLFRWRGGVAVALDEATGEPARAVGAAAEMHLQFSREAALPGDRFLMAAGDVAPAPAFALQLPEAAEAAILRLDILEAPAPDADAAQGGLKDLPLRPAPREGEVWDGFRIGRTIYRGRYTVLHRARDEVEARDVVLKIPLKSMLQDKVFAAGFMREAWVGGTVRGHHVARYIEVPAARRHSLYLVMPYYEGETLEARLRRGPSFTLAGGIGVALQLCAAVRELAAIQVIHRDIKPENIILRKSNEVMLLDLGLAYLPGLDAEEVARPGGTLRFMAPELLRGVQANARTEVYALGVTIYRIFAGAAYPFGQREVLPLKRVRPDIPSWVGRILRKALAVNAAERFADAGELAAALQTGLATGASDVPAPRLITKLRLWQAAAIAFGIGFFVLLIRAVA